jgi:spermidine/putrescine transport system permease protein
VNSLKASYGPVITALIIGLAALWIIGLIFLPQLSMLKRAFLYEARDGAASQAQTELERAYQRIATLDYDIRASEQAAKAAAAPKAPSPSAQNVTTPNVSAPRPVTPSVGAPPPKPVTPGLAPSPGAAPSNDPSARLASLRAEKKGIESEIATLQQRFAELDAQQRAESGYSLRNFTTMSALHWQVFFLTLLYALAVTVLAFIVCYPIAYALAEPRGDTKAAVLFLGLVIPYAINELLRIFAWTIILANNGILNSVLDTIGMIDLDAGGSIRWMASNGTVFTVMVYTYILFMVFPIYNTIETLERSQIEAAKDLGASTWRIHARVVLPHAKPGIAVGSIMTFMLSAGSISVPGLIGPGMHPDWFSQIIYRNFFESANWNVGSALSVLLLLACTAFILLTMRVFGVSIREIAK